MEAAIGSEQRVSFRSEKQKTTRQRTFLNYIKLQEKRKKLGKLSHRIQFEGAKENSKGPRAIGKIVNRLPLIASLAALDSLFL